MARTTVALKLNTVSIDEVIRVINSVMVKNGFENKIVRGEDVWTKGDGVIVAMSCIAYSFTETEVVIQAWLRDALLGESDLSGSFIGRLPKEQMKKMIQEIRIMLQNVDQMGGNV